MSASLLIRSLSSRTILTHVHTHTTNPSQHRMSFSGGTLGGNNVASFPLPAFPPPHSSSSSSSSSGHPSTLPHLPPGTNTKGLSPEMEEILREQARVDQLLGNLEAEIAKREDEYFEKTAHGNIVRGWDGVLDNKPPPKRRYEGRERVFTWSSYTYWARHGEGAFLAQQASETMLMGVGSQEMDDGGGGGVRRSRSFLTIPSPRDPKVMAAKKRKRRQQQRRGYAGGESSEEEDDMSM